MTLQKILEQLTKEVTDIVRSSEDHPTRDQIIEEMVEMHGAVFAVPAAETPIAVFKRQVASTIRNLVAQTIFQEYEMHGSKVYSMRSIQQSSTAQPVTGETYRTP